MFKSTALGLALVSFAPIAVPVATTIPLVSKVGAPAQIDDDERPATGGGDCQANGDTNIISNFTDDSNGTVSLNIDVNGDAFGSTHNGTVSCNGPVTVVSEQHRDGGCHYDGNVTGGIYSFHTQCGNFAGVHYTVTLRYR